MLITSLLPMLSRYSLGFDLVAGANDTVTLTVIPRKAEGTTRNLEGGEIRPISITAPAAEIDAELAKGMDGALGQLIAARKALGDQLAEQQLAAETAKKAATDAAKNKAKPAPEAPKTPAPAKTAEPAVPISPPVEAKPAGPASLW